jgi:chromosome partitioning protein
MSVINFKGGVGKTTLSFHLAAHLSRRGKTLLVDVDHQSSLSIAVLGATIWGQKARSGMTVNRIFDSFCNRRIQQPAREVIVENAFHVSCGGEHNFFPDLDLLPSQFELDDTEIDLASTNYGNATLSDWEKRTLLSNWLDTIEADRYYRYIVFDCPPATKIVSQNAIAASHFYVIPVIPDEMSSRGVDHFRGLVDRKIDQKLAYLRQTARIRDADVPRNFIPTTQLAAIVPSLARIAHRAVSGLINVHTQQLEELRARWNNDVTQTVIRNMAGVSEAMNAGWPVWNSAERNANAAVRRMMTAVCEDIRARVDP